LSKNANLLSRQHKEIVEHRK